MRPEIAAEHVATVPVPHLDAKTENNLADMVEEAANARDGAGELEQAIASNAEELIDRFLAGGANEFAIV